MNTRERLVEAAADLFYDQGLHRTGIDSIVEHSGLSKPTLYKYFRSKDELIAAALEYRQRNRRNALRSLVDDSDTPRQALEELIEFFARWFDEDDYRGCALVNGAIELPDPAHPGRDKVGHHKVWMTDLLTEVAADAGLAQPRELAESLALLIEGATVMAYVRAGEPVGQQLKHAARALTDAHETPTL